MRFFDGGVKDDFEEGFNFGFDVWVDRGKNLWRKAESCARANGFELGVRDGSDNVIFKLII